MNRPTRRTWLALALALVGLVVANRLLARFPAEDLPEGAYLRIATALERGAPEDAFPYLEEEAQVACYTIRDYAKLAAAAVAADYPEAERRRELARYQPLADAGEPPRVWSRIAEDRGWLRRLRRDLSGGAAVEVVEGRATVTTARGTRYSFRRRPNGIWGLTSFTAQLDAEARRLARDSELVKKAAADFRAGASER
ncbi:MAG: hypothetical protein FJ095_09285 [Deltaproteobacteria bacterium]|nr:hypothetical protein [Deltaproteobacteria bacterium]